MEEVKAREYLGFLRETADNTLVLPGPKAKVKKHSQSNYLLGLVRYLGPGFLVTVGFIDPGNWATNMAGGASYNFNLLWVITLSTLMLILLQNMAARLGIVTGKSMAENCRQHFRPWAKYIFGGSVFVACIATSLAEYLGAALGLNILLGIPLWLGAVLSMILVSLLISLKKYHSLEKIIMATLAVIAGIYIIELFIVKPEWSSALPHIVIPSIDSGSILVAMGMLGAVIMPHNLYLHSSVVQSRQQNGDFQVTRRLLQFKFLDTLLAMGLGWVVNSSMIIVAATVFFTHGVEIYSIEQAAATLTPLAGNAAGGLFAVALLMAGLGSSLTSSFSNGNIFTGYLGKSSHPHNPWFRWGMAILTLPAIVIIAMLADSYQALIWSQIVLSIQLPLTIIPLLLLANNRKLMGSFATKGFEYFLSWLAAATIFFLNGLLLYQTFGGKFNF
ncbi:MAG: Nramp family divalent metal transporter [Bacillota bacterium]